MHLQELHSLLKVRTSGRCQLVFSKHKVNTAHPCFQFSSNLTVFGEMQWSLTIPSSAVISFVHISGLTHQVPGSLHTPPRTYNLCLLETSLPYLHAYILLPRPHHLPHVSAALSFLPTAVACSNKVVGPRPHHPFATNNHTSTLSPTMRHVCLQPPTRCVHHP